MTEDQYWKIIEELAPLGHRAIREIEDDIIDRQLLCPDLPLMPYTCKKHKLSPEKYIVISQNVHEHECPNTVRIACMNNETKNSDYSFGYRAGWNDALHMIQNHCVDEHKS